MTLKKSMHHLRLEAGISQKKQAEAFECSQQFISLIETGKAKAPEWYAPSLAALFKDCPTGKKYLAEALYLLTSKNGG